MQQIKLSDTIANNRWIPFQCFDDDAGDNFAPKTGLTFGNGELRIAKRGGAAANALNYATVVEAGNGWYWYQASSGEVNTLGPLMLIVNKSDVYADATVVQVVAHDPNDAAALGLGRLDAAVTTRLSAENYEPLGTWLDLPDAIESGVSMRDFLRLTGAALAGVTSGAGTGTEYFRSLKANHKVRITATIVGKNRTALVFDTSD